MKIIYAFIIALILSVLAFFLAIRITDSTGAALFLLGMLPITFFIIFIYTKLLDIFHVRKFVYVKMIKKVTGSIPNKKSAAPVLSVILIARKKASTERISAIIKA